MVHDNRPQAAPYSPPLLAVLLSWAAAGSAAEEIDIDVDFDQLGAAYALLVSFTAAPEIAASRFNIDENDSLSSDTILKTTKLPLYHEFSSDQHQWRWYIQGTANYTTVEQKVTFDLDTPYYGRTQFDWTGYGGLLETGIVAPLLHNFSWTLGLGGGVSRLESKARFDNSSLEGLLAPQLDGTLYNWDTNTSILRSNLGLLYDVRHGKFGIKGSGHYTYSKISTFSESSRFPGFSDYASVLAFQLDVSYPLGFTVRDYPTYVVGHLGNTSFLGDNRNELGFSSYSEAGLSIGVGKVILGAMAIGGNNVDGWNIILNYDY